MCCVFGIHRIVQDGLRWAAILWPEALQLPVLVAHFAAVVLKIQAQAPQVPLRDTHYKILQCIEKPVFVN